MIFRFFCFLYMGHFTWRTPSIERGQWYTNFKCWCGHINVTKPGLLDK
jgi:hypothetical protein